MRIRTTLASIAVAASALTAGGLAVTAASPASPAQASTSYLQTVSKTETMLSGTTYHLHQVTVTYYHWVTAQHRYVRYPSPRVTVTDQTITHK